MYIQDNENRGDTHGNRDVEGELAENRADKRILSIDGMGEDEEDYILSDSEALALAKAANAQGQSYLERSQTARWQASYNQFGNQHITGSKYLSERWRGRSSLYRPKTRSAVRKKQADAAAALFASSDLVEVTAENDNDPQQLASAAINKELLQLRLDRPPPVGLNWFLVAMASHQTAQITTLSISKQYWEYREEEEEEEVQEPMMNPFTGAPLMGMTGPVMQTQLKKKIKVVRDRPVVRLFPPEEVIRDPGADWQDQAQESSFVILKYSMPIFDILAMIRPAAGKPSRILWRDIPDSVLLAKAGAGDSQSGGQQQAVRRSREQSGTDRKEDISGHKEFRPIWVHENFIRCKKGDYHFYTLGSDVLLSDPMPVKEAYPEFSGSRPVVIGYGSLEAFKIDPMSPVESWRPLQQEMNDLVNLRLDIVKQTASPITIVKRGRNINLKQIQNRSADTTVMAEDPDTDIRFERPGEVSQSAFIEMERLNADFDDQAGNFSPGSVQTNRTLNETVGGMNLLSGSANAISEFDLRIWVITWVEPVLRQLIKLEQYNESDTKIMALAADKAQLYQKFKINEITDDLLAQDMTVRVNVGVGAADPMQRLQKFTMAANAAMTILGPAFQQRLKADEVVKEIFGHAGYRDGERFLHPGDEQDPRIQQLTQLVQALQKQLQDKQADRDHEVDQSRRDIAGKLVAQEIKPVPPSLPAEGKGAFPA